MALTFNMHLFTAPMLFLIFGCLQPSRAHTIVVLQGVVQSRMGHPKTAFAAAGTGVTNKLESWDWPNPGHCGCGVCSQEDGDLPATGDGRQLHQGWERKHEIFLSPDKPLPPAVSQPTRVSFYIWEQVSITYR